MRIDDPSTRAAEAQRRRGKKRNRFPVCGSAALSPICLCVLMLSWSPALTAADAPTPTPPKTAAADQAAPIDPATAKQAEAAADAYLKQLNTRPDPLAEAALADIEVLLLEAQSYFDLKQPLKAGERYLSAIEKRKTIDEDQGPLLGKRLVKVDRDLLALSRQLLGQAAYDLGEPQVDQAADQAPAEGGSPQAEETPESAK